MSGIAGCAAPGRARDVERMLQRMAHRGPAGRAAAQVEGWTIGVAWTEAEAERSGRPDPKGDGFVRDGFGHGRLAEARFSRGGWSLVRDEIGVAPLYYGFLPDGVLVFASEVKALAGAVNEVREFPPGTRRRNGKSGTYFELKREEPLREPSEKVAAQLRRRLETSVARRVRGKAFGCWLSGGLDSSVMAALARPRVETLHTFAAGTDGAPDLKFARQAAEFLGTKHHELVVTVDDLLKVLPDVIASLESFDPLLVRSSVVNWLVAREAAKRVGESLSGEGGDELFAGYDYLRKLPSAQLADELVDITGRLHNTALQRVDRSAAAHGLVVHTPFLDPTVVDYALRIPASQKIRAGVEKWILRRAVEGLLPKDVLNRRKSKFWQGAGVGDLLARHADKRISDLDFYWGSRLPNGWRLRTKEELFYRRIFRERLGEIPSLDWMGRSREAS